MFNKFNTWFNTLFENGWFGYNPTYVLRHPWIIIRSIHSHIKWAWQRVFNGYDERIAWNIDSYLAEMIPKWIKELKNGNISVPSHLYPEGVGTGNKDRDKFIEEKWNNILDEIIEGFNTYEEICYSEYGTEESKILLAKFDNGFDLFQKYFMNLWD